MEERDKRRIALGRLIAQVEWDEGERGYLLKIGGDHSTEGFSDVAILMEENIKLFIDVRGHDLMHVSFADVANELLLNEGEFVSVRLELGADGVWSLAVDWTKRKQVTALC